MKKILLTIVYFTAISLFGTMLSAPNARPTDAPPAAAPQGSTTTKPKPKPHSNHVPQHGGVFFMALDNKHHLEGVLLQSGTFKIYLYDAYTKPLPAAKVLQAHGTVQVGESADAPIVPLVVGKDGQTLEAALSKGLKLPVTLTLSLRLPDSRPDARPEVFTFPFSHYIEEKPSPRAAVSAGHSGHAMDTMKADQ